MMMTVRLLAITAILLIGSTTVRAEGNQYAGIGLGSFQFDAGVGARSVVGGYVQFGREFMPYLSAEIRLGTAGSATKNGEKMQMDWMVAHFIRPYFDVTGDMTVYGLAGFTVNHSSLQVGAANKLKKTNISLSFGAGAQYDLGKNLALAAEWASYARESDSTRRTTQFQGLDISSFSASLKYEF